VTCVRKSCGRCFYCDGPVTRHEHDHAPLPQRCGGAETVPACVPCHTLKDRTPILGWPLVLLVLAAQEIADRGCLPAGVTRDWPGAWDDMTGHARVLWAKCAAIASDHEMLT